MGQSKSLVLLAGAALSLSASAAFAQNDEVRSIVAEAMADAESRSSLLAAGDAGHDGRFFVAGDGYRLNISGQLQTRYIANFRDDANTDDFENGFQIRRAKIGFAGDVNKDWFFNVRGAFDRDGGSFTMDYGFAGYKFANGVRMTVGQFKLPLLREELVSSAKQLAAERSVTNEAFTQNYSQGVSFDYEAEAWRVSGAFSDGLNSANTDITNNNTSNVNFAESGEADYAFTGRFEYMFAGNWQMFEDFTAAKGQDFGALLGVAGHWQQSTNTQGFGDIDRQTGEFTVDVSLEGDSWNAFAAYIGRYTNFRTMGADTDLYDSGIIAQAGWRFAENTEVFARYDLIIADEDRFAAGAEDNFSFLTVGLNQYWAGHAAKGTLDLVWSFDKTSPDLTSTGVLSDTGVGLLGDSEENEITLRAQFQLLF